MNSNVQRKLNAYAAAAGAIAVAGTASAQVNYTDINPDTIVHDSVYYDLDMDNNGQPEMRFETVTYTGSSVTVNLAQVQLQGDTNNAIIGSLYYGMYPFPYSMNNGDSISSTNTNWHNANVNAGLQYLGVVAGSYTYCNWLGVSDKYLGVRFKIGANTHYGWVRLSVNSTADTIWVKDYAYELLPNVGITAGQMVGIPSHNANSPVRIFASGNTVVLQNTQVEKGGTVRISNMLGQNVYETAITDEHMRIGLGNDAPGIYFVEVLQGDEKIVKKVYIQ